jgi:hypothetical protein
VVSADVVSDEVVSLEVVSSEVWSALLLDCLAYARADVPSTIAAISTVIKIMYRFTLSSLQSPSSLVLCFSLLHSFSYHDRIALPLRLPKLVGPLRR